MTAGRVQRLDDWPERLVAVVARYCGHPFVWGEADCATFFSDAVAAVTGTDPLARFRPWRSETEACRRLIAARVPSIEAFVAANFSAISTANVRRGDLGFAAGGKPLTSPAVVTGAEAVAMTPTGLVYFPISALRTAYGVG